MIRINNAEVFIDKVDDTVYNQIEEITRHPVFKDSQIRIMPDCHAGKGCVIGFTSITEVSKGIIPNIVGVDIGCGIRTVIFETDKKIDFAKLDQFINKNIPSGMGIHVHPHKNIPEQLLEDIKYVTDMIKANDSLDVFINSIGTLGSGNHFIEVDKISENRYMLAVHTGSRGFGFHICKHFQKIGKQIDIFEKQRLVNLHKTATTSEEHQAITEQINNLPEVSPDLAYITGPELEKYMDCMHIAMRYASQNRQFICGDIMEFLQANFDAEIIDNFDTIHNYVDWNNDKHTEFITRKGSVNAELGKKLCIPMNMRDGILIGVGKGKEEWNRSAPHGAGRRLSRSEARETVSLAEFREAMSGIETWSVHCGTIDESPQAYKDPSEVIPFISENVDISFIAKTVYNFKAS